VEALERLLTPARDLAGARLLVTSGPTREPIDPVRYLSNRSSGKMGHAITTAALRRGAAVTLISGPTALTPPPGATFVPVQTAEEMREAALQHLGTATVVIKAAAVADYRVANPAGQKIKSKKDEGLTLELVPNPDILRELAARKGRTFLVGFAAETNDLRRNAQAKLAAKGIDLLVANDVSRKGIGFEADDNQVVLLDRWGC
jgi:phosphopantothenoylcysteine decarboxylase/phosphopantothenate--cysteine ligase